MGHLLGLSLSVLCPARIRPQQLLRQRLQIRLQPRHALRVDRQRAFVHVELAVDL